MTNIFQAGGFMMYPLLILSVITLAYAMQRVWSWLKLVVQERQVVQDVLTVAQYDLDRAAEIAAEAEDLAIGRFLSVPLKLNNPNPENFHLALKAAADKELVDIGGSDKLLESVIVIAPLLGILGTAGGLITTFIILRNAAAQSSNNAGVADAILKTLISSAAGITVAILAFVCLLFSPLLKIPILNNFSA